MGSILTAMNDMAGAMTAVDASRRQVRGVAGWRDLAAAAIAAGQAAGAPHAGELAVPAAGSRTHGQWMTTADAIITTLNGHAAEARGRERQASADREGAEANKLPEAAAAYAALAAAAAGEAEAAEEHAEACEAWAAAAADASACGARLTASEDAVHAPVGQAIADAGGRAWIADDKHFLTGGA